MAFNFDAQNYDTKSVGQKLQTVPAGIYKVSVEKCSLEPGKRTEGSSNIKVMYNILEGDFKDNKIFQNIVYENLSEAATQIGRTMFAKVCKCCGKLVLYKGPEELVGSTLYLDVVVEPYKEKDTEVNRVFNVFAIDPMTNEAVDPDQVAQFGKSAGVPPAGFGVQTKK